MGQNLTGQTIASTYEDLVQISGSVLTNGLGAEINSLQVNASTATSATSASYALTASYALNGGGGGTVDTGSLLTTASISDATITFTKGDASTFNIVVNNVSNASTASIATFATSASTASLATQALLATSASHAVTASYALNVTTPDLQIVTDAGATTTNTIQVSGSAGVIDLGATALTYTSGDDVTAQQILFQNSGFTNTATIDFNPSSGDLTIFGDGVVQLNGNASTADTATTASYASTAESASHALNADSAITATSATSASYATTASHALGLADGVNINVASITASAGNFTNITATSASIGFLQTVTGSATIIGDAFIILNTSDAQRYAGLIVEDSGSATPINYTASYFFDSLLNDWNYEYTTTSSTDYAVALFGPAYSSKGTPTYLTANKVPVASGSHHLVDSSITDDGSTVLIESNTTVATTGATADLVVTSDDDFTYQSTLRIGGGSGGAGNSFYLSNFNDTSSVTTDNGLLSIALGGTLQLQGLNYPSTDGNAGEILTTDGAGNLSFATASVISASYATTASRIEVARTPYTDGKLEIPFLSATPSVGIYANADVIAKNTFTFQASSDTLFVTGSVNATSFTGSLLGTASFATSASWAPTPATPNLQEVTTIGASTSASIVLTNTSATAYNTIQGDGTGFFIQSGDDSTDMLLAFADSIGISTGEVRFAPTTGLLSMYADNGIEVQSATTFTQGTTHTGATTFSSSVAGVVNPLTISSQTASMDCSTANFFTLELPNADTHLVASNIQAGQTTNLRVTHTSTSSGSLAFSDSFLFAGGTAFEVTPATSSVDVMTFISFNGSTLEATGLKNFS